MNEEEKQATEIAKTQEETEAPEEEKSTPSSPLGGRSVFAYLAVLFGVAFLLLLFAYLMQQRDSQEITANLSQLRESMGSIQSIDELVEENRALREEMEGLKKDNETLQAGLQSAADDLAEAKKARERAYTELQRGYDKYVGYTSILGTLYSAEIKLADKDYEGAADDLTDIQYQYFVDTIEEYDAETEHYNPEGMFLRPRFDALVEELTKHGALDGNWAAPMTPEGKE